MFLILCFSGNPIFTHMGYSNTLLVGYTILFLVYILFFIDIQTLKKISGILTGLIALIFIIVFFQRIILGAVAYKGVMAYIIKILLSLCTILYYRYEKIDFIDTYVKTLAFLAVVSIPFWILNQFGFYGLEIGKSLRIKSLILYTSYNFIPNSNSIRNSGMFWEPGAFAGYLILALVFIALKNKKFQIGPYGKEILLIFLGLLTSQSTTGYVLIMIIIIIHSMQTYRLGKIVIVPFIVFVISLAYSNLNFMKEKIETQLADTAEMDENDISPGRFGAWKMDWQYIKSQPLTGNGWHESTRYRFHPQVKDIKIGHGNGMSNIIAIWGIPFFLFWLLWVYRFSFQVSRSFVTASSAVFIIILLLQGEQFLNTPVFLSFFFLPYIYVNILSTRSKVHIITSFFKS